MSRTPFEARLLNPRTPGTGAPWTFVVLPKAVSGILPRRGRVTADLLVNGQPFQVLLEPDGQQSHWLRLDAPMMERAEVAAGDLVQFEIAPVEQEPEPRAPSDLLEALHQVPAALTTWTATTALARLDWIHWVESARQAKTRAKRIDDACDMLAAGKKRVCCFDPSGYYSKAFKAPQAKQ